MKNKKGNPKIVDVPVKMEKFFGKGKMLHPTLEDIEDLIKTIPKGKLATIDTLCSKLASDYGVDVTCPMRTGNTIKKISERYTSDDLDDNLPFWRVVRKDKLLIKAKNYESWATKIEDEGFDLSFTKSNSIKVDLDQDRLFVF